METKPYLVAADVKRIAQAAEAEALKHGWKVSIAIVDDGGHLLHFQRLDGAVPMSVTISQAKAHAAAMGWRESRQFEESIANGRTAFLSAPGLQGLMEGGVPIVASGHFIGAVGVSGVKSPEDAQVAKAGIAAL